MLVGPDLIHPDHFLAREALAPATDYAQDENISDNTAGLKLDLFTPDGLRTPVGPVAGSAHRGRCA